MTIEKSTPDFSRRLAEIDRIVQGGGDIDEAL
jgi:hypothetical protein